jgi:DNA-binding SARP family transcriptional activator/TolB-like protein
MPDVFIRLLGDVEASVEGVDVRMLGRKARALLAIMATSPGQGLPREMLADLLWNDRGEEQARSSLRQAIGELRRCRLGAAGVLAIDRDQVAFVEGGVSTDVGCILAACRDTDIELLAHHLAGVKGIFMAGFDGLALVFDDWLRIERYRNHELIVTSVLQEAPGMLNYDNMATVRAIVRALEKLDPNNEVVARLGMNADHLAGDGASLHRRYRQLCQDLEREFGSTPVAETRALFNRLTAEASAEALDTQVPTSESVQDYAGGKPPAEPAAQMSVRTPPMVMISPFVATDGNHESEQIAAAATDDIRVALARHPDICVIALDSLDVERIEAVCTRAFATYMLSGRLRRSGGGARVNLQLGNVSSSVVIWSEQLRLDQRAIEDVVDPIVAKAVGAVIPAIDRDFAVSGRLMDSGSADAVSLYAQARHLVRSVRTLEAVRQGMALLEQVIMLSPAHVGARLLLAQLYNTDLWQQVTGHNVAEYRAKAMALVVQAAGIEPENTRIRVKLAWCYLRRGDWSAAEGCMNVAIEASPYDADAMNECALGFAQLGDVERAIDLMQRAFLLNPFPPADYPILMAMKGECDASEQHFEASGETRLQYIAARLANLSNIPRWESRRVALRTEFLDRFKGAWQGNRPIVMQDFSAWLDQTYVFRDPVHRRFWTDSFAAALR